MAHPRPFATVTAPLDTEAILAATRTLSKRGKLPGFETECPGLFRIAAFGTPFDYNLTAYASEAPEGIELRFVLTRQRRMPLIFAIILLITVYPGVWFTDSTLSTWFRFYAHWSQAIPWLTYAWYLPLTVLPIPWMWRALSKKSRVGAETHAREQISKIRTALGQN